MVKAHTATAEKRISKRYAFDDILGPDVTQEQVYELAGVQSIVDAVVCGYHGTVLAYGQTGSGKTFTMEGFRYVVQGSGGSSSSSSHKPATRTAPGPPGLSSSTASGSGSSNAPAPARPTHAAPFADFAATPPGQLGIIPRAVTSLFKALQEHSATRGFRVVCSFVQIYKEQAYDLLNPAFHSDGGRRTAAGGKGGANSGTQGPEGLAGAKRRQQQQPPQQQKPFTGVGATPTGVGGALKLRWSKGEEFHLENVFKVECCGVEDVMGAFRQGVRNKVMSSHRLNASSSRSHCLLQLHLHSWALGCPEDGRESRLTLVDLAGSERAAQTGAVGAEAAAGGGTDPAAVAAAAAGGTAAVTPHIPYRDSKLTSLLKHSLGGNSLTTMIACVAAPDCFADENLSTLEYASRASRMCVAINEDPRAALIRQLRAEIAFLQQQLGVVDTLQGAINTDHLLTIPSQPTHTRQLDTTAVSQAEAPAFRHHSHSSAGLANIGSNGVKLGSGQTCNASSARGDSLVTEAGDRRSSRGGGAMGGDGADGEPLDNLERWPQELQPAAPELQQQQQQAQQQQQQLGAEVLAQRLLEAVRLITQLGQANGTLRSAYSTCSASAEASRVSAEVLSSENVQLRCTLGLYEGLVDTGGGGLGEGGGTDGLHTAASSALMELTELRRENGLLHQRLQQLELFQTGAGSVSPWSTWPASPPTHAHHHHRRNPTNLASSSSSPSSKLRSGSAVVARRNTGGSQPQSTTAQFGTPFTPPDLLPSSPTSRIPPSPGSTSSNSTRPSTAAGGLPGDRTGGGLRSSSSGGSSSIFSSTGGSATPSSHANLQSATQQQQRRTSPGANKSQVLNRAPLTGASSSMPHAAAAAGGSSSSTTSAANTSRVRGLLSNSVTATDTPLSGTGGTLSVTELRAVLSGGGAAGSGSRSEIGSFPKPGSGPGLAPAPGPGPRSGSGSGPNLPSTGAPAATPITLLRAMSPQPSLLTALDPSRAQPQLLQPASAGSDVSADQQLLNEVTHAMTSRAAASSLRISSVGKLLSPAVSAMLRPAAAGSLCLQPWDWICSGPAEPADWQQHWKWQLELTPWKRPSGHTVVSKFEEPSQQQQWSIVCNTEQCREKL
ncbi:MAG: hypothetical protein WDW38_007341 [Sanguina aurantia]